MAVERVWVVRDPDREIVKQLGDSLDCPDPISSVLANRGLEDPDTASRYLDPTPGEIHRPEKLPDLATAVERLELSLKSDESVVVYADRDIDGISGAAILVTLLDTLGADVEYHVPGKWDGYGMNAEAIDEIAAGSCDLIVTVDCGTTAIDEVDRATSAGVDVIVTDHHEPEGKLPDAVATVNPRRDASEYPHDELAGGAVAFKVGQALVESHSPLEIEAYHGYAIPLASLATLGDYVTLHLENRALVREGFDRLYECDLPGLVETARHCGVESMRDISWSLVPLLNSAQEDESGQFMLEHLLTTDWDEIAATIDSLEDYRDQRREQRADRLAHLRECVERQADPETDVLFFVETDRYVGGVPMTRLSEEIGRPVIAYREQRGMYRGGGRSDPDVDFIELFEAGSEFLEEYWGHPGAAGFRVTPENLDAFEQRIVEALHEHYRPEDLRPRVEIDARLTPQDLHEGLVDELDRLQPFGPGNEEPVFLMEGIEVASYRTFGAEDQHCKLVPAETDQFTIVHWDGTMDVENVDHPTFYDVAGTVGIDNYEEIPALTVTDIRVQPDGGGADTC